MFQKGNKMQIPYSGPINIRYYHTKFGNHSDLTPWKFSPLYNFISHCTLNRTALLVGWSRDRFPVVSLGIFSIATDRTMCPGVNSASKTEYQGFLLG